MRRVSLHPLRRDRPKRFLEIKIAPFRVRDFSQSLAGYEERAHERAERVGGRFGRPPYFPQLSVAQNALAGLLGADDVFAMPRA